MRVALVILQVFTGICLLLLPIAVFRRTWMFRVGITKKDHRATRRLMLEWTVAGILASALLCGVPITQLVRDAKAHQLASADRLLERRNLDLELRTAHAETERAKLLQGGAHYLFDGSTLTARHHKGRETVVFDRMVRLRKAGDWSELAAVAERQIALSPQWLTPYLFLGQASLELGRTDKAMTNLRHVTKHAPLDPEYRLAHDLLAQIPPAPTP